jgi:hypothetical protein
VRDRPIQAQAPMPTSKGSNGQGKHGKWGPRMTPADGVEEGEWFDSESTSVDTKLPTDWAHPPSSEGSRASLRAIEQMVEEALVAVPLSPIEDHRAALPAPPPEARPAPRQAAHRPRSAGPGRWRTVLFAVAGLLALATAAWLIVSAKLF